jgi:hypothetical protein
VMVAVICAMYRSCMSHVYSLYGIHEIAVIQRSGRDHYGKCCLVEQ